MFRAGAVLVTVDAYPQKDGKIVEGLTAADFEILEDGKPQKVENLEFVRSEPALTDDVRRDPTTIGESRQLAADLRNRLFIAYLDVYHVDVAGSRATQQPLVDVLNRMLAPNDLFGVMTPKMRPRDLTFGRKLQSIDDQLTRNWPWGERMAAIGEPAEEALQSCVPIQIEQTARDAIIAELRGRRREDITLTNLEDLVAYLATLREARTDILLFTDGWLQYRQSSTLAEVVGVAGGAMPGGYIATCRNEVIRLANIDDALRFRSIITEANRHNITFYPVNPGGLAVFDSQMSERSRPDLVVDQNRLANRVDSLRTLAENTDGIAVVGTNDLMPGMRRIADDVSAYYLLGYYSTNTKFTGGFRKIQVRMKRPDLKVKARRGYFAPDESKPAASIATAPMAAAGPSPVDDALSVLGRLRPSAELYSYGAVSGTELIIAAEIANGTMAAGKWSQGGDVQAIVTGASGGSPVTVTAKLEPGARGTLLRLPLSAGSAGPWQVTFKVSGGGEAIEDRTTITKGPASALLGDAVIYRAAPGPRAPLRPAADFQFRRTERVHIEWPMLKPFDDRQARLLSRTGQPLAVSVTISARGPREDSESSSAGARASGGGAPLATNIDGIAQSVLAADCNLAPLAAGDYVIEVTAGTGADAERKLIAIRVIQ